jgi:Head domain of trimeric autotransporter adhesin
MKKIFFLISFSFSSIILFAQNVGIGTLLPKARLHVTDSSVAFSATGAASATPGNPPISGAGRRMMWYADKGAFRAGHVVGQEWDKNNIGNYSFATGSSNQASGIHAVAMGYGSIATSNESFAMGNSTQATGFNAIAMGLSSIASGGAAVTIGYNNSSTGNYAVSMGAVNNATGNNSTAMGSFSTASGDYAAAHGRYLKSKSFGDFATGLFNDTVYNSTANSIASTNRIFEIGNGTSNFIRSNAVTVLQNGNTGIGTVNPTARLHVVDSSVVFAAAGNLAAIPGPPPVSGNGRRMMWYADRAAFRVGLSGPVQWNEENIGNFSFVAGSSSVASGVYSASIGVNNDATGTGAIALGGGNRSEGNYSLATGGGNIVDADFATVTGNENKAKHFSGFVSGIFNDTLLNGGSFGEINDNNRLFQIGNGTSNTSRSNAITVLQNGNIGVATTQPNTRLDVNGDFSMRENNLFLANGNNHNLQVGLSSFANVSNVTANYTITGISAGVDGKIFTIVNSSPFNLTIAHLDAGSDPVNRINTLAGANISTIGNGSITFQYSTIQNRWMVIAFRE